MNPLKNNLFLISIVAALLSVSCQENEAYLYQSPDNIYFNFKDTASSRIVYSFAYTPDIAEDTIFVPIRISGERVKYARKFKVVPVAGETTAQPEKHYRALDEYYEIPADSGKITLPVIIYNKDPEMDDSTFVLTLALAPTPDFQVNLSYIPRARISFSNRLESPGWWMYWMADLGLYSRVKHQLFLISSGTTELADMSDPNAYLQIPKTLFHISQYKAFLGDPFGWVKKHGDYSLTEVAGGDYHFYLKSAPEKVTLLKKDAASGIYWFMDEKGQIIS